MSDQPRTNKHKDTQPAKVVGSGAIARDGSVAAGERGVAVGGDVTDSIIITGDITLRQRITNLFLGSTEQQRALRNRRAMLELVRSTWIERVLESSLHGAPMIAPGMIDRADAIKHPWDIVLERPKTPSRVLPRGTRVISVFSAVNRRLLILGAPGSGKTTVMLELARDAINRAENDPTLPIPAVFNLSSWADKGLSVSDWLVDELKAKYHIAPIIGRTWVEKEDLLLLLDGLDEVRLARREECVEAINRFLRTHGFTQVVVCCRVADHELLRNRLELRGAVLLRPLSFQQINEYLAGAGTELSALREAIHRDKGFRELAQTPLMLNIMVSAYRDADTEDLLSRSSRTATHLFDTYVKRMFGRRMSLERCSPKQTIHWLAWLARKMFHQAQTIFLIDRLHPGWLSNNRQRWVYALASRVIVGLFIGIVIGLILRVEDLGTGVTTGILIGLVCGLYTGCIYGARLQRSGNNPHTSTNRLTIQQRIINALVIILGMWLLSWLVLVPQAELIWGLILSLMLVVPFGIVLGVKDAGARVVDDIQPSIALRWSWLGSTIGLTIGVGVVLIVILVGFFITLLIGDIDLAADWRPIFAVVLLSAIPGCILGGLSETTVEHRVYPNQGIIMSLRNAVAGGLVTAMLIGALTAGLVLWLPDWSASNIVTMPLLLGSIATLWFGGVDVLRHCILRATLVYSGCMPGKYVRFLDYATDRIFLHRVGSGYKFYHGLLQEHFASLTEDDVERLAGQIRNDQRFNTRR